MIVTEWRNFKAPDFAMIKRVLTQQVVFDGHNMFDPAVRPERRPNQSSTMSYCS